MPSVDSSEARAPLGSTVIAHALRWWLDELAATAAALGTALRLTRPAAVTITLAPDGWVVARETGAARAVLGTVDAAVLSDDGLREALARLLQGGTTGPLAVLLPPAAVLTRPVRLPAAALADLDSILEFEVGRHTPFTAERAYWRHRIIGRGNQTVELELSVAPRDLIDGALRRLAAVGMAVESVSAGDLPAAERRRQSLMPRPADAGSAWTLGQKRLALTVAGAALLALLSPLVAGPVRLAAVEREIAALQAGADAALAARQRQDRTAGALEALASAKRAAPSATALLLALTRALPDDSHLTALQLTGRELTIEGLSPAAAALAGPLESAGPFARVFYRAPITRDPQSGLEQFQFGLTLAERTP